MPARIYKVQENFKKLNLDPDLIAKSIENLKYWLLHPKFENYESQIEYLIESEKYLEIFDAFYQTIPFGTSGRRGKVGIGPNRINPWTIAASAQGHSQYLVKKYADEAKKRGIVIAYDVRQFTDSTIYNPLIPNPVWGITSCDLARIAASVYDKNGIKVYFFNICVPTPQLSFTIRKLNAISGINISASHNPPDFNGKKIYNEHGGQLLPPDDQELADEINNNVNMYDIEWNIFERDQRIQTIESRIEDSYINEVVKLSKSKNRNARVLYSPLHGTGKVSVYKSMKRLEFDIHLEGESSIPSGEFETIPDHIANPELPIVYERLKLPASEINADLIITSDPDADRIGLMARDKEKKWQFFSGNEIAILVVYAALKRRKDLTPDHLVLSTICASSLIRKIGEKYKVKVVDDFLPGFKYFAAKMDLLEKNHEIEKFVAAVDDTYGHLIGNYARDKDATNGGILLTELTGELKLQGKCLNDVLNGLYKDFGYFVNTIHEINFEFSFEKSSADHIMEVVRMKKENCFTAIKTKKFVDHLVGSKILSETDHSSRNLVEFVLDPTDQYKSGRIIIRPSGTEAKLKIYIELEISSSKSIEETKKLGQEIELNIWSIIDKNLANFAKL